LFDPDGEDVAVAKGLQKKMLSTYAGSATYRRLYDSLNKDRGFLQKLRLGKLVRAGTKAETHVESTKRVITGSGETAKATVVLTTIPAGSGGATLGHELQHGVELRDNADIRKAPTARQSMSGVEGDVETEAALTTEETIARELQDATDDIQLTQQQIDEILEASENHPGCAEGTGECPKPK
jgi:hypothetical protein